MTHDYAILDVFTEVPLEGNPVAVFTDAADLETEQMQRGARELNLSETVFLTATGPRQAEVRIFTPALELPFAGHPVLGAAALLACQHNPADGPGEERRLTIHTGAGPVPVAVRTGPDGASFGEMEQPVPEVAPYARAAELLAALGLKDATHLN